MNIINTLGAFSAEFLRALRNFKYELTDNGVLFTAQKAEVGGVFGHQLIRAGEAGPWQLDPNKLPTQGLIHLLWTALGGGAQSNAFYLAPFGGNVTPSAAWTAANFPATATEFTSYTAAARLPWTTPTVEVVTASLGNSNAVAASTMEFDSTGASYTVYGAALLSASAKSSTAGKLIAASRFGTARTGMVPGDKLALEYVITATDASA
jgi:hypothetical protein